tara:strand:+ start:79 stop:351 length:273 start_codon:yes stop_codon:yes gene_type:complete
MVSTSTTANISLNSVAEKDHQPHLNGKAYLNLEKPCISRNTDEKQRTLRKVSETAFRALSQQSPSGTKINLNSEAIPGLSCHLAVLILQQ